MAQSLARLWTHLIFSTKDRFPFLTDKSIRRDMHAYLATMLLSSRCSVYASAAAARTSAAAPARQMRLIVLGERGFMRCSFRVAAMSGTPSTIGLEKC